MVVAIACCAERCVDSRLFHSVVAIAAAAASGAAAVADCNTAGADIARTPYHTRYHRSSMRPGRRLREPNGHCHPYERSQRRVVVLLQRFQDCMEYARRAACTQIEEHGASSENCWGFHGYLSSVVGGDQLPARLVRLVRAHSQAHSLNKIESVYAGANFEEDAQQLSPDRFQVCMVAVGGHTHSELTPAIAAERRHTFQTIVQLTRIGGSGWWHFERKDSSRSVAKTACHAQNVQAVLSAQSATIQTATMHWLGLNVSPLQMQCCEPSAARHCPAVVQNPRTISVRGNSVFPMLSFCAGAQGNAGA